jgi:hypothetical protein
MSTNFNELGIEFYVNEGEKNYGGDKNYVQPLFHPLQGWSTLDKKIIPSQPTATG